MNCDVLRTSLNWFAERKLFVPCSSVWNFDRGKLVIPSLSMKYNPLETVMKSHSQVIEVVGKTRSKPGKIRIKLVVTSSFIENCKVSHCNAWATKMCMTLCRAFEEGEEDFTPMGFMSKAFLPCVNIHLFVLVDEKIWYKRWLRMHMWLGNQKFLILLYLIATFPPCSNIAY